MDNYCVGDALHKYAEKDNYCVGDALHKYAEKDNYCVGDALHKYFKHLCRNYDLYGNLSLSHNS